MSFQRHIHLSHFRIIVVLLISIVVVACRPQGTNSVETTSEATPDPGGAITLGDVNNDPSGAVLQFQPLADYLASGLGEFGISVGQVRIAPDFETMSNWLSTGEVDLYFDSVYPALQIMNTIEAQPLLRRWRRGVAEYNTVFFALRSSGLETLADLETRVIALEGNQSTSGYLLPLGYLIENGFTPLETSETTTEVGSGEVGYVFSGEDENTIQWVISGRVIAGAVDNINFSDIPQETREQLVVLGETLYVPRQVALARPGMDPELQQAVIDLLLAADESDIGRQALEAFRTTQFDAFPDGVDAAFRDIRRMYDLVNELP
jgi:phosphonate transport system substrate-binding protein